MEDNKEEKLPAVTMAMKEMLINCRDRALLNLTPRLDYDIVTSKDLVDIGYFKPKTIIQKNGKATIAFFITNEAADYLSKQRQMPPLIDIRR